MDTSSNPDQNTALPVKVDAQGHTFIPESFRKRLGIEEGGEVLMRLEKGELIVESKQAVLKRLQARFAHLSGNVVDELIEERREEAKREAAELRQA